MESIIQRLTSLTKMCGCHHVPRTGEAFVALRAKGMEHLGICEKDRHLSHVAIPANWRITNDDAAESTQPGDLGSVVIMADNITIASIVPGTDQPEHYELILP